MSVLTITIKTYENTAVGMNFVANQCYYYYYLFFFGNVW